MDSQIYRLLARADQEKDVEYVRQAFNILDPDISSAEEKLSKDIENFSQNLYVECAEKAINFQEISVANRCIQLYFSLPMIANQFLARAYLCQFELLAPKTTNQLDNLEKSIPFLFKAIDFSTQNKRYNFLVYNASIIFWKYARSFLKQNYKRFLCSSLNKITNALKEIDDADYEWRAFLKQTLIEAYMDNNQMNEATSLAKDLAKFIQSYLPTLFDEFYEFLVNNILLEDDELKSLASSHWELNAIYKIVKLKKSKKSKKTIGSKNEETLSDENIQSELNDIFKILLPKNKFTSNVENKSEFLSSNNDSNMAKKDDHQTTIKRQKLMLSLAHLCLFFEEVNLCSQILGYLKESENLNEEFSLETEFIECDQTIKELKHKQEKYTKNIVRIRTECINKCHEVLRNALRSNSSRLIQLGCLMQWNFCLPLFQPGLRNNVRKPLQFVAECLETIESMEWLLRSQIHFELAKCDEEIEQLQTAEQHLLKALHFDDEKVYTEQLNHALKRLRLRAELYKTPERIEDQVAMILEQCVIGGNVSEKKLKPAIGELLEKLNAKKNGNQSGNGNGQINTRSLLLRAGDLLAPNEFTHVLESETFKANFGKLNEDQVTRLYKKTLNYENCVRKGADHLQDRINAFVRNRKRSNPEVSATDLEPMITDDYKERLRLWFDLSKIARKQQIWDICRVSSRFCLLYDNEQSIGRFLKSAQNQNSKFNSAFDKELMRNLAEAHFILGESLVQYIRGEGIELFEKPKVPEVHDSSAKHVKIEHKDSEDGSEVKQVVVSIRDFENDKEWLEYCEWLGKLCKEAVDHFLKGIKIGVELNESWLVCQGSAYIWNYFHHIFEKKKHTKVLTNLNEILDALKKVGHDTEPELTVAVCIAISTGLIHPWLPQDQIRSLQIPILPSDNSFQNDKQARKPIGNGPVKPFSIPSEANADIKKALEICEYGMNVTNGEDLKDLVSLKDRFPLIKTWVLVKQINQSPIKNFGLKSNSGIDRIQDKFTKCMIGVEILNRNSKMAGQNNFEIKEAPSIKELINLIDQAQVWPDKLIELELWSNLAILAGRAGQTDNLRQCYTKSLESLSYFEKKKYEHKNVYIKSQFLLSEACIALGEHLAILLNSSSTSSNSNSKGNKEKEKELVQSSSASITSNSNKDIRVALRRNALNAFADASLYASNAENYENVVHAARHYWNLALPYLQQAQERATLYENLKEILSSWNTVFKFKKPQENSTTPNTTTENDANKNEEKKESDANGKPGKGNKKSNDIDAKKKPGSSKTDANTDSEHHKSSIQNQEKPFDPNEDAFDDFTLRCVLYACLFQILIDKNQHEEALEQMEIALNELPRTKHRLLIYRFKVITKSKLGLDVQMDLQKFKGENEKNVAQMYRKVALSSIRHSDTINAYQRAIETLNSYESIWLKFEYILELAQWMYSHEYNLEKCTDLCEWAIDLLMFRIKHEKQDKSSRASSPANRALTARTNKSQTKSKAASKLQSSLSVLPTIEDETELRNVHKKMEKNTEEEMEHLSDPSNKENLFDIGQLDENRNTTWSDLQDIKQLECLIRANTILVLMTGQSSINYTGYLLKAYYSVVRLLHQAIENAQASIKEIQKLSSQESSTEKKDKSKAQSEGKNSKMAMNNQAKKGKSDTGPGVSSGHLPQTIEQWSQFELSDEIAQAWSHDLMKKTGINQSSIHEPYLLFFYLDELGKMLNEQGYSQLLFPLYYLQLILVNSAIKFDSSSQIKNNSLNIYIRMKLINLCTELNLIQSIGFHQQALASLILNSGPVLPDTANAVSTTAAVPNPNVLLKLIQIDPTEVCLLREQVYSLKQRLAQLEDEESAFAANSVASFTSSKKGMSISSFTQQTKLKKKQQQQLMSKNQNVKIHDSMNKIKSQSTLSDGSFVAEDLKLTGEQKKIHNNLHDTIYKDVWILMADFLIQNGYFQIARDYLFESLNACVTFDDQNTMAKVQYYLGKIALYDCNFIEARNYASNAQKIAIDELFWYKSIRLLVDSHRYDHNDKDAYEKCIKILNKSLDLVFAEKSNRANKSSNLAYIEAMLNYELAEITTDGLLNGKLNDQDLVRRQKMNRKNSKRNSMHPSIFKQLIQIKGTYNYSIELLINNGYKRDAIDVIKSLARLLRQFGNDCFNIEAKKDYFLQTLNVLSVYASNLMDEILMETLSLQSSPEIQNISLPIQREFIELKLEISQLLTDILEIHLNEIKNLNDKSLSKDHLVKTLENFIGNTETLNEIEQQWRSTLSDLPDFLSTNLASCHSLSLKLKNYKASTLYLIGRTYRLTSDLKYQLRKINLNDETISPATYLNISLSISKWNPAILDLLKPQLVQQSSGIEGDTGSKAKLKSVKSTNNLQAGQINPDSLINENTDGFVNTNSDYNINLVDDSNMENIVDQEGLKNLLISVNQSDAQAMECLLQAQNLAFTIEEKNLSKNIAYELVELIGRFDMQLCSQFIALYQSYSSAIEAENLIQKSSINPKNSLLTGYLNQLKFYKNQNASKNSLNSPIIKQLLDLTKMRFNAFKCLNITSNHFNFSKDFPSNYIVLVLQHNDAKNELFGAILERSKSNQSGASKVPKQQSSSASSKASVIKLETDPFELYRLQQQWKDWKSNLQSFNLKLEFQLNNDMIKKSSSNSHQSSSNNVFDHINDLLKYYMNQSSSKYEEMHKLLNDLEAKFEYLIKNTEIYLKEITDFVQSYFAACSAEQAQLQANVKPNASAQSTIVKPTDKLIILADLDLLEFPLESLKVFFDNTNLCSVSRDFSLQFFATRFYAPKENSDSSKADDKKTDKASKPNPKQTQAAPVALEPLPEHATIIDNNRVKFLIDAFNEASSGLPSDYTPNGSFKRIVQQYQTMCSKWTGLTGSDHSPSLGECENLLLDSNCLIFNGTERFLSYFSSNKIASLNLNDCRLVFANDMSQTAKSFSRLGKDDVLRNSAELECENPLEASLLLSLTGIRSIMSNQWTTNLVDNCDKFSSIMKEFLENRQSCGEILRSKASPHLKLILAENMRKEEERRLAINEKDKKGDSKKTESKKETKSKSPTLTEEEREQARREEEDAEMKKHEEETKRIEMIKNLSRLRKENLNMVCYGLPDVFISI